MGFASISLAKTDSPSPFMQLQGISGEAGISHQATVLNKIRICYYSKRERESRMDIE